MQSQKLLILAAIADGDCFAAMTSKLRVVGDKGEAEATVLFDTGAGSSFILRSLAEKIATIVQLPEPITFRLANGTSTLTVKDVAIVTVGAPGKSITDTFLIIDNAVQEIILGENTMRRFGLKIDMERNAVYAEIKQEGNMKEFWKKVCAALSIAGKDDATEEQAIALLKEKATPAVAAVVASPKILAVLDLKETASEDEVRGAILALKSPGNVVAAADVEKLKAELHEHKIIAAVAAARADGKISSDEEPKWTKDLKEGTETLAAFATFVERRGKVVPIAVKLPEKKKEDAAAIDEAQKAVNKQMGLSDETFRKYNPAQS